MRGSAWPCALALAVAGCVEADPPADPVGTGAESSSTGEPATTMPAVTTASADDLPDPDSTSAPMTTADDSAMESSSSGGFPPGPTCSVQEVTEGELLDPVLKGDTAGLIPTLVGDTLEDYCGCHTIMSNAQNLKFMFLKAPGGTLFLEYADLMRPYEGGTLGQAMGAQVTSGAMPPGSCSFPEEPDAILAQWFADGMPDGATFEPR